MTETLSKQRWVFVMLACFWVSCFDLGLQPVTGTFFDAMLEYYGSDRTTTASVSGLFIAVNQCSGIIVGLLVQRFGISKMSFIGAILIPFGFILCAFVDSVIHVLLLFGVISALGVAIMFVCSFTMIREVCSGPFKKWLALCLTLNSSFISFAGFSLPYLITFLNDRYALPGVFLAFGGILTNNVRVSLLFYFISKQIDTDSVKSRKELEDTKKQTIQTVETKDSSSLSIAYSNKLVDDNYECDSNAEEIHDTSIVTQELPEKQCSINGTFDVLKKTKTGIFFIELQTLRIIQRRFIDGVTRTKELMFGHVNIMFACLFLGVSLAMGTFDSYATIIIDMLESKGFPQDMAIHAYIPLNVCALISRILPGIITAIDPIWFVVFYSFCGTAGQVILLISSNYAVCMVAVGLTGMTMGGVISAATIMVANSIDIEKFAVAFGQILTGIGIVVSVMTPVYGALRDTWGNYDIVLTTTGIIQSLGALLCIIGWTVNGNYKIKQNNEL